MAETANINQEPAAWIRERILQYTASGENGLQFEGIHEPAWAVWQGMKNTLYLRAL